MCFLEAWGRGFASLAWVRGQRPPGGEGKAVFDKGSPNAGTGPDPNTATPQSAIPLTRTYANDDKPRTAGLDTGDLVEVKLIRDKVRRRAFRGHVMPVGSAIGTGAIEPRRRGPDLPFPP